MQFAVRIALELSMLSVSAFGMLGAQSPTTSDGPACTARESELLAAARDVHARQKNIGLGVAVVHRGQAALVTGLGFSDLEHRVPVINETRFGIASITKAFTGVALLTLVEQGKVDLDAPVQRYVPTFPVKPGAPLTSRQLAAHLAGIRHWNDERTPALYARHFENINDVLPLFQDDSLLSARLKEYSYSSYGYDLLGAVIQSASGEPYPQFVRRAVIDRLGLSATGFDDVRRILPNRSRRYSYYEPTTFVEDTVAPFRVPEWDYSHNMAAGNMYATTSDLVAFGRAIMRPGFLNAASMRSLHQRPVIGGVESPMSFGFFVSEASARHRDLHITGSNAGLQAALYIFPDDDLVVVVLANTWGVGSRSGEMVVDLPKRLAAICLGDHPAPRQ